MRDEQKRELLEQYDDAAFALLMDEYAEDEGARLMAEFREAALDAPTPPDALDDKCLGMIRREYAKKRRRLAARKFARYTAKAAVAVLVFIGLMTTVVMSVDALRVPILEFIVEHHERYSSMNIGSQNKLAPEINEYEDPITQFVPSGYYSTFYKSDGGYINSLHCNDVDEWINFDMMRAHNEYRFDTEGAVCEYLSVMGYDAVLAVGDPIVLVWYDDISGIIYNLSASDLSKEQLLELAQNIVIYLQEK